MCYRIREEAIGRAIVKAPRVLMHIVHFFESQADSVCLDVNISLVNPPIVQFFGINTKTIYESRECFKALTVLFCSFGTKARDYVFRI